MKNIILLLFILFYVYHLTTIEPTFHVLITTIGRSGVLNMIDSLQPQLDLHDSITVVYDAKDHDDTYQQVRDKLKRFRCVTRLYYEHTNLGFWGHAIRNKYSHSLQRTTFVMHGDDDDVYLPDVFKMLRKKCKNKHTLYMFKFKLNDGRTIWKDKVVHRGNVGTPCGIVPFEANKKSKWTHKKGGDGEFYIDLSSKVPEVQFVDEIIYHVRPAQLPQQILKYHYYINLKNRPDRRRHVEKQLQTLGINSPNRFEAIQEKSPPCLGSTMSHCEVIKKARSDNWPYVFVFEDDVMFYNPRETFLKLKNLMSSNLQWDVILLGGNNQEPYQKINKDCVKVQNCAVSIAYVVHSNHYDELIRTCERAILLLKETRLVNKYCIDQYWKKLQKSHNYFLIIPLSVTQKGGFSNNFDIGKNTPQEEFDDIMLSLG